MKQRQENFLGEVADVAEREVALPKGQEKGGCWSDVERRDTDLLRFSLTEMGCLSEDCWRKAGWHLPLNALVALQGKL